MKRVLLIGSALYLATCTPDTRCDPGQRYELGSCFPELTGARDAGEVQDADTDASSDAASADAATDCKPGPGNYEGFGDACKTDRDCTSCVAPTCATAPINQCSHVQCQDDPSICPPGWNCTDIRAFSTNPNATHICLKL